MPKKSPYFLVEKKAGCKPTGVTAFSISQNHTISSAKLKISVSLSLVKYGEKSCLDARAGGHEVTLGGNVYVEKLLSLVLFYQIL